MANGGNPGGAALKPVQHTLTHSHDHLRATVYHSSASLAPDTSSQPLSLVQSYSPCISAASTWGSHKVISMVRYISMAVDSSARACSKAVTAARNAARSLALTPAC